MIFKNYLKKGLLTQTKNVKRIALFAILFSSTVLFTTAQVVQVGSVANSRAGYGWNLDGYYMAATKSKLQNPVNFGGSGTAPMSFQFTHLTAALTPANLAPLDVFFIGYIDDGTLSAAELTALYNWVNAGGSLIITADSYYFDDVAVKFGFPSANGANTYQNVVVPLQTNHPIFNGPFGTVTSFYGGGTASYFNNANGASVLAIAGNNNAQPVWMEENFGAGRVVLCGDIDAITTYGYISAGNGINNVNDILAANLFAYMTVPAVPPAVITITTKGLKTMYKNAGASDDDTYYNGISRTKPFTASIVGGTAPYTYAWSTSSGSIGQNSNKPNKAGLIYPKVNCWVKVEITDANSNVYKDSVLVPFMDYTCPPAQGMLWYYELCDVNTNITSCVKGTSVMDALVGTGNYVFGSCALPKKEINLDANFSIYPNPSNGMFTLNLVSNESVAGQANVFDLNGRVLISQDIEFVTGSSLSTIDLSDFDNGIYTVQLTLGSNVVYEKVQLIK